jgi:two-component sensor histidine kinase
MAFDLLSFLRTRTLERSVVVLLVVGFSLLIGVVVATGVLMQRTLKYDGQVNHSHEVRALAAGVLTDAVNAETGQRGYLLTGERDYLGVAEKSVARLTEEMRRLRLLVVADGPELTRAVDTLKIHVDAKVAELKRTVAYFDAGRRDEALADVKTGRGRDEMERIRAISAEIDGAEASLLEQRRHAAREVSRDTLGINSLMAFLIFLIGVVTVALVGGYLRDLRSSRAALDQANHDLEGTVAERTQDLVRANEELSGSRDRAEALLREVNHRVANSLAIVSGFVRLQARVLVDDGAKSALEQAQARIQAVAQIHKRLYTSDDVGSVDLQEYLTSLAEELQHSLAPSRRAISIHVEAEPLRAPTDQAVSIGVIVAELVTNAAKYAYPRGRSGEIRVRLKADGSRGVLSVEDDGRGLPDGPPKGTGLGSQIISAMAHTLKSKVEYRAGNPHGVSARLAFHILPPGGAAAQRRKAAQNRPVTALPSLREDVPQ